MKVTDKDFFNKFAKKVIVEHKEEIAAAFQKSKTEGMELLARLVDEAVEKDKENLIKKVDSNGTD